ncbi:M1 family metallopeptidase [Desulfosarcina ovata]|uniref:Aminopeptidase n=1 Tax=Desulfosarcina ovata subsp. ovata TaxID=2752305 RepID=A0A5K8AE99_9BACT|nr:M1 family metallopeptidase [Desulfosarcina ovata]BBO91013.1 aminopeptidase [Desulfosarcina ovata subsp. ovata]
MTFFITPDTYALTIEPDLDRFTFAGQMVLSATADQPVATIDLDCAELAIWRCLLGTDEKDAPPVECAFCVDPAKEALTVQLPKTVSGSFVLTVEYTGRINDRMAGFYRSRIHVDGGPSHMAVTQFQESDARRAFPCFDHPARKAVFTLEMLIPKGLTAIANTAVQSADELDDGRQRIVFEPTPKMSTYLLFFGVGPFEIHTDDVDPRVRAVCLPGMGEQTGFGRVFGRKALAYGEEYYAIDYPLSKMDLIAVPDFAFGAMENWGAITFRENLLLHVPGVTSREGESRICEVIAHEIAHQWFGNLVTPEDWKYLWLNESFATYFGYGMVDHYHGDWEIWQQFVRSQTETALARDALHETFAIEMPGGAAVAITTSTAPIIYSKGGSVLRQLEAWIGPDHFKAGLRHYLKTYTYGSAASHHLWEALSEVSGMPVTGLMKSWVTQPGFPVITVRRSGETLAVSQRLFSYLPNDSAQFWMVPLTLTTYRQDGSSAIQTLIMDRPEAEIALPPGSIAYKINPGQTGFYHVHCADTDNLDHLGAMVKTGSLPAMDRWGVQNDLYALVKSGALPMATYLTMAGNYINETDYLPLSSLDSHLFEAYLLLEGEVRTRTGQVAESLIHAALATVGDVPVAEESQTTAMLRDQLLVHAALLGNRAVTDGLDDQFKVFMGGGDVPADIFRAVMTAGAVSGDQAALDAMIRRYEASSVEHERMTLVAALGSFRQWPLLEKALDYALERVPDRIRFMPLVAAAGNPAAGEHLWPWFEANLARMQTMHPLLFERVVAAFVPGPGLTDPERTRAFCKTLLEQQPRLKDVLALSLERLAVNAAMKAREK